MSLLSAELSPAFAPVALVVDIEDGMTASESPAIGFRVYETRPIRIVEDARQTTFEPSALYKRLLRELSQSLLACAGCCGIAYQFNLLSLSAVLMFLLGETIATLMAIRIANSPNTVPKDGYTIAAEKTPVNPDIS